MNRILVSALALAIVPSACAGAGTPAPASATVTAPPSAAPSPVTLKIGQVGGISDAAIYIADAKGFFKEQGITLDSNQFASAALMVAPLGTGELQVGGGASSAGLFNAIGRGIGMLIVADKGNLNPGHGYEAIVVRPELAGQITGPKDLKGRTIAVSARDITPEVTLDTYLRTGGLTIKDVNVVAVPHADMLLALKNGSIDAGLPIEPFVSRIVAANAGTVLTRNDTITPGHQTAVVLFSEALAKRREVATRFMTAYIQGARFYNDAFVKKDAAKRAEAVAILSKAAGVEPALFDSMVMPGIDPNGRVNTKSLGEIQDWFLQKGTQQRPVDLTKAIDPSFSAEVVRQLGEYR